MKIQELRQKSEKELKHLLQEDREKLRQLKFDLAGKKLKNIRRIKETRRDIARIMTLMRGNKNPNFKAQISNQIQNPNDKKR